MKYASTYMTFGALWDTGSFILSCPSLAPFAHSKLSDLYSAPSFATTRRTREREEAEEEEGEKEV